jgi:hypothetical protein
MSVIKCNEAQTKNLFEMLINKSNYELEVYGYDDEDEVFFVRTKKDSEIEIDSSYNGWAIFLGVKYNGIRYDSVIEVSGKRDYNNNFIEKYVKEVIDYKKGMLPL